ncbi:hypothetical protein [Yoonia sp. R2-816]|uniref:hypothetical protein n=1 Tax=Yoonia sp. R2-816 TaxID=3342638 RepID=UPI00372BDC9D
MFQSIKAFTQEYFGRYMTGLCWTLCAFLLVTPVSAQQIRHEMTPRAEQTMQSAKQSLQTVVQDMRLSRSQRTALDRSVAPVQGESLASLERKREAVFAVLTRDQRRQISLWERQTMRDLAAAGIDDETEGPATFILCVLICEMSCDSDCNCSYCALTLPIPDP